MLYNLFTTSDTLYYKTANFNKDPAIKYVLNKSVEDVLGKHCNEMIIYSKQTILKYYFNEEYFIDPNLFNGHSYGNWHYALQQTKSLPLKIIVETPTPPPPLV